MRLTEDIQEISCSLLICSCQNGVVLRKWQNVHLSHIDSSLPESVLLTGTLKYQRFVAHFVVFPLFYLFLLVLKILLLCRCCPDLNSNSPGEESEVIYKRKQSYILAAQKMRWAEESTAAGNTGLHTIYFLPPMPNVSNEVLVIWLHLPLFLFFGGELGGGGLYRNNFCNFPKVSIRQARPFTQRLARCIKVRTNARFELAQPRATLWAPLRKDCSKALGIIHGLWKVNGYGE